MNSNQGMRTFLAWCWPVVLEGQHGQLVDHGEPCQVTRVMSRRSQNKPNLLPDPNLGRSISIMSIVHVRACAHSLGVMFGRRTFLIGRGRSCYTSKSVSLLL